MAKREEYVKVVAVSDFALAVLSIVYETLAIAFGDKKVFKMDSSQLNPNDKYSINPPEDEAAVSSTSYDSTKLLSFLLIVGLIYGIYLMQMFMASKLFMGSKMMPEEPISSLQKFSCWRIWSFVFLFILLSLLALAVGIKKNILEWPNYILIAFLSCHILFRIFSIHYVGICRKHLKDSLASPYLILPPVQRLSLIHHDESVRNPPRILSI